MYTCKSEILNFSFSFFIKVFTVSNSNKISKIFFTLILIEYDDVVFKVWRDFLCCRISRYIDFSIIVSQALAGAWDIQHKEKNISQQYFLTFYPKNIFDDFSQKYFLTLFSTRSVGALRAPTSSWRPFRPLDFVLRALRALRPCDLRVGDLIVC